MPSVYIETTIPSYLAARPAGQPLMALHQKYTRHWWEECRQQFDLHCSTFVVDEVSGGDPAAAARRLDYLTGIPLLPALPAVYLLAADISRLLRLPPNALLDASHLAVAIFHRMDYLLTWNCTHLTNPVLQRELIGFCQQNSLHVPVVCTPEHLLSPHL